MYIGFNHTTKVRSVPDFPPWGDDDTFAPVFERALTNRTIPGTVWSMTTRNGVIPTVLITFATPSPS